MAQSKAFGNVVKLRDIVNVKDPAFGARGNGATDDAAAIQAAATLLTTRGGIVWAPRSTYKLGAQSTFGAQVYLEGEGQEATRFNALTNVSPFLWSAAAPSDVQGGGISNCSISGDGAAVVCVEVRHIWPFRCERVRFRDGPFLTCLLIKGHSYESQVLNNRFTGYTGRGVQLDVLDGVYPNSTVIANGNDFAGNDGATDIQNLGANDINIAFNHMEFAAGKGGTHVDLNGGNRAKLIGNNINGNSSASTVAQVRIRGGAQYTKILGGDISLESGYGIDIESGSAVRNITVSGVHGEVTGGNDWLRCTDRDGLNVNGCIVRKTSGSAGSIVNLAGAASDALVNSNVFTSSSATGAGITVALNVTSFNLGGNDITGFATGIVCNAASGGRVGNISGNDLIGNTTSMTVANHDRVYIRDNPGFKTSASGTDSIASGSTSKVVNHGCALTPTADDITVTMRNSPTNDPGFVYVDTLTATQMTVRCRADPGASGLDFAWKVVIE